MGRTDLNIAVSEPRFYLVVVTDPSGNVTNTYSWPTVNAEFTQIRSSTNTPGFRELRKSLQEYQLPMNPFHYRETQFGPAKGETSWVYPNGSRETHSGYPEGAYDSYPSNLSATRKEIVDGLARSATLAKLKDQKVNLGNAFVQRGQTVSLIQDAVGRLGSAYHGLKSGKPIPGLLRALGNAPKTKKKENRIANFGDRSSSDFLAIQYGVKPLISDVYDSLILLEQRRDEGFVQVVSGSNVYKWNDSSPLSTTQWNYAPVSSESKGLYAVKYVVYFRQSLEHVKLLSQAGITNPLAWAWEVLPWSFVVDWFLRVGDWIDTFDATAGLEFVKGSVTTFEKWSIRQRANAVVQGPYGLHGAKLKADQFLVDCRRVPLSSFPSVGLPRLGSGFTAQHTANALALSIQATLGNKRKYK